MKARLSDYGIKKESISKLVPQFERHGVVKLEEKDNITPETSRTILDLIF